jgi:hypothetical protein
MRSNATTHVLSLAIRRVQEAAQRRGVPLRYTPEIRSLEDDLDRAEERRLGGTGSPTEVARSIGALESAWMEQIIGRFA